MYASFSGRTNAARTDATTEVLDSAGSPPSPIVRGHPGGQASDHAVIHAPASQLHYCSAQCPGTMTLAGAEEISTP